MCAVLGFFLCGSYTKNMSSLHPYFFTDIIVIIIIIISILRH